MNLGEGVTKFLGGVGRPDASPRRLKARGRRGPDKKVGPAGSEPAWVQTQGCLGISRPTPPQRAIPLSQESPPDPANTRCGAMERVGPRVHVKRAVQRLASRSTQLAQTGGPLAAHRGSSWRRRFNRRVECQMALVSDVVGSLRGEEAAKLVESNFISFWSRFDRHSVQPLHSVEGVIVISCTVRSAIFNLAIATDPTVSSDVIRGVIGSFGGLGVPFRWAQLPSQARSALGSKLEAAGLTRRSASPAMVLSLSDLKRSHPAPKDLSVEHVLEYNGLKDFARILNAADFHLPPEVANEIPALLRPKERDSQLEMFLGRQDSAPIATALRYSSEDTVGIYAVSTLEAARGKGIGSSMTYEALLDGKEAGGAQHAVLVATRLGFPVYRRLGFEQCGEFVTYVPA